MLLDLIITQSVVPLARPLALPVCLCGKSFAAMDPAGYVAAASEVSRRGLASGGGGMIMMMSGRSKIS